MDRPITPTIMILNGPNLNMLGLREPEIYGHQTLDDIRDMCEKSTGYRVDFRQSNHEGELVTWIQGAVTNPEIAGMIINAAGYTHTSVAIHDALKMLNVPIVEVHLSNPHEREDFRHHSYITPTAAHVICGQGAKGYAQALDYLSQSLK